MRSKIKNLLLELSEIEEDIVLEFCAGNRLGDPIEVINNDGKKILVISDMDTPIARIFVSEKDSNRILLLEIVGLQENKQEDKEIENPNELIRTLLYLQEKLLR